MFASRMILGGVLLAVATWAAGALAVTAATSSGDPAAFGIVVTKGINKSGGSFSDTSVVRDMAKYQADRGVTFPIATEKTAAGAPPADTPAPLPGAFADEVRYVALAVVAGGSIRWIAYRRNPTKGAGADATGPWVLQSSWLRAAPANCTPDKLDNCPTLPE